MGHEATESQTPLFDASLELIFSAQGLSSPPFEDAPHLKNSLYRKIDIIVNIYSLADLAHVYGKGRV